MIVLNARAAARERISGVERTAREIVTRLVARDPLLYVTLAPVPGASRGRGQLWEQTGLPRQARALGAEIIYSPANLAPLIWPANVLVLHDAAVWRTPASYSRVYRNWHRLAERTGARRARAVITVSEFSRREIIELLGVDPARVHVIANGVGPEFGDSIDPAPVLARYGITGTYVFALASAHAHKNPAAFTAVAGGLGRYGIELIKAGGDGLGYVPDADLPALYAGAAAFLMPSYYEGFGIPCLEAMACGTPVVAADRAALPEICGDAALLVDPDDHVAMVDALLGAIGNDDLIAAGCAQSARFTWERAAEQTDSLLRSLCA